VKFHLTESFSVYVFKKINKLFENFNFQSFSGILLIILSIFLYSFMFRKLFWHAFGDEGFILLGYQKNQILYPMLLNESFLIVRNIFPFLSEDPIIELRLISLLLNIISLFIFSVASFRWLRTNFNNSINPPMFFGLFLISGLICQPWPPTLHYNSIQLILYLFILSFFLLFDICEKRYLKRIFAIMCGFLLIFSIFNYVSSGLLLFLVVLILGYLFINKKHIKYFYGYLFLGVFSGFVFYHFKIRNLSSYFSDLVFAFNNLNSSHTPSNFAWNVLDFIKNLAFFYLPIFLVYLVIRFLFRTYRILFIRYFLPVIITGIFLYLKFNTVTFRHNIFFLFFLIFILVYYIIEFKFGQFFYKFLYVILFGIIITLSYKYSGNFGTYLLFLPWGLILTDIILKKKNILNWERIFILFIITCIPIFGEFGTNLTLDKKLSMFSPVYAFLFFLLLQWNKESINSIRYYSYILIFLIINLSLHYHLGFYSFKKGYLDYQTAKYYVLNAEREKNIIFSEFDKLRYEEIIDILKKNGFRKGDEILASGVDYTIVYIAGGFSAKPFIYGQGQFDDNINRDFLPSFIIIPETEQDELKRYAKKHFNIIVDDTYYYYPMRSYLEWSPGERKLSIYCKKVF